MEKIKKLLDFLGNKEIINKYRITEIYLKCFMYQDNELTKTTTVTIYPKFEVKESQFSEIRRFSSCVYVIIYQIVVITQYTTNLKFLLSKELGCTRENMYSKTYSDLSGEVVIEFIKQIKRAYF